MMAQFMMDLKTEPRLSPSLYSPASPRKMADQNCRPQSTDSGVLDLSKRRDSMDTRKTPSPSYHCFSDAAGTPPPSNHSSPQCEPADQSAESAIMLNYGELVRARRLSPTKSLALHFDEPTHPHHPHGRQAPLESGGGFHHHGMALAKPDTDILQHHLLQQVPRTHAIPSYLLPAAALQHHHLQQQHQQHQHHQQQHQESQQQRTPSAVFSPSPIRLRELDALSESGSEGTSLVTSSQRKPGRDEGSAGPGAPNQYPMVVGRDGKLSRPFKAYPRDPLSLAAGFVASDTILDTNSAEKYSLFRKRMLEQIHAANGGQPTVSNPKMRRLANSSGKSGPASSASLSAAMSDASSESCDEKPPSKAAGKAAQHPASANMAAKAKKQHNLTTVCNEMAQRAAAAAAAAAANQRRVTPSKDETNALAPCDSDSSHHSDASESKRHGTDSSSCDVVTGSSDCTPGAAAAAATANGTGAIVAPGSSSPAPSSSYAGSQKDSAYYERRKKNNAAAKKSRDRRRIKEDEIAIRAAFLERENIELKFELAAARKQLAMYGATPSVAS